MSELTLARLFDSPPILGELPSHVQCAPNGKHISWLQSATEDRERLDLWVYQADSATKYCLLNAAELDQGGLLSDAEKALKERKRQFSTGVTSYAWHPNSAACVAVIDGMAYLVPLNGDKPESLTLAGSRQTEIRLAPNGERIAFVRAGDLYVQPIKTPQEQHRSEKKADRASPVQITHRAHEQISYGLPDFIAQEEMHRFEGYWWADGGHKLVYTEVDESNVAVSQRYEIDADQFRSVSQRYPFTGADNPQVRLAVQTLTDINADTATASAALSPTWVEWADDAQDYLARVHVHANALYVQCQNRAQTTLTLKRWQLDNLSAPPERLLVETATTWLNLHNNLTVFDSGDFLWTSSRDGHEHLYVYSKDGDHPHQLTRGEGRVNLIVHADEQHAYFLGWFSDPIDDARGNPTQQQLYRCDFSNGYDSPVLTAITSGPAWHDVIFSSSGNLFVDRFSTPQLPAQLDMGRVSDDLGVSRTTIASLAIEVGHPYHAHQANHQTPQIGSLQNADADTLYYRLTPPAGATQVGQNDDSKFPVVVYVYGGPGGQKVTSGWAPLLLQLFSSAGIGVLEVDNRGTGNRSEAFDAPIHRRLGSVEVADQIAGVEFLHTVAWADTNRLGVFGHSYGGYMTLMCMANAADYFKAGVAVAPVSAWELYDTHYTERYLGTPQENPEGYAKSAVLPWLEKIRGELLIMHGMADDNVLFTHSTRLFKALQDLGTPFQMMTYPGSKHALQERSVSVHRFEMILRFFKENL